MRILVCSSSVFPSYCFSLYGGGASVYRAYSASMRCEFELVDELELERYAERSEECVEGEGNE